MDSTAHPTTLAGARGGASASLRVEEFRGKAGFAAIRGEWARVLDTLDSPRFFQRWEWYASYLEALEPDDRSVHFLVMYRGAGPVAIFPLKLVTWRVAGLRLARLQFPRGPHMALADFLYARTDANAELICRLVEHLRTTRHLRWDALFLAELLEDSAALFSLQRQPPKLLVLEPRGGCDYLPCESFAETEQRLSKNFRANLRKARNRLQQLDEVEFVCAQRREDLDRAFDEFLRVEASGWKGASGTASAIALDDRLVSFYRSLIRNFSSTESCEINLLKTGERGIAAQFCLLSGDTSYVLKIGYDERYAKLSPGSLLREHQLKRYAAAGRVRTVNLVTDAAWHVDWRPRAHRVFRAYVFNTSVRGRAMFAAWRFARLRRSVRDRVAGATRSVGRVRTAGAGPTGQPE